MSVLPNTDSGPPYYGKYRGTVVDNADPEGIGRLKVSIPDVNIAPSTWAMPCFPVAGRRMGLASIPPLGAGVWVEFEAGDPDFPIWVGCWWGARSEVPTLVKDVWPAATGSPLQGLAFQTETGTGLRLADDPRLGIVLETAAGAKITIDQTGITLDNGSGAKITLSTSQVDVNNGALTVT